MGAPPAEREITRPQSDFAAAALIFHRSSARCLFLGRRPFLV
jgi:hypothetical protein